MSRRVWLLIGGVAAVALIGAAVWHGHSSPSQPVGARESARDASPSASPTVSPSAQSPSSPVPSAPSATDAPIASPSALAVTPVPAPDVAGGERVAVAFAVAYETVNPGDTEEAIRRRLLPYDTAAFNESFGQGGGGGQLIVASASVQEVQSLGLSPDGHLVVVVTLIQTIEGQSPQTVYLELYESRSPRGWLVDEVNAS